MAEAKRERVGLVFVSHSSKIAEGLVELAAQMAPSTELVAAGGTADGGLGTDFARVLGAIEQVVSHGRAVVLADLGSAVMIAESAIEMLEDDARDRVRLVGAPLVEGGVAAAVSAEMGGSLSAVVSAAEAARGDSGVPASGPSAHRAIASAQARYARSVELRNPDGLHARPAAEFVKLAGTFPARVTANGTDAKSLLGIMSLGLGRGTSVEIATDDAEGRDAVDALVALVERDFAAE